MFDFLSSTNSQSSILSDLQNELLDIKDRMKNTDAKSVVFDTLSSNANKIQSKVDVLLTKKGLYTQSDIDDAFKLLQDSKRTQMQNDAKKSTNRFYLYIGIAVAVSIGVFILIKKR
jgi:hypothetical protein